MSDLDKLNDAMDAFTQLMENSFHIVSGKSGSMIDLTLTFEEVDFHHLIGLQYIKDIEEVSGSGTGILSLLRSDPALCKKIVNSSFWSEIEDRVDSLIQMERTLSSFQEFYKYNKKAKHSIIDAQFIIKRADNSNNCNYYICVDKRDSVYFAKSQFTRSSSQSDYCKEHTLYKLLLCEKIQRSSGQKQILFQKSGFIYKHPTISQSTNIMSYQPPQLPRSDVLTATDTLSQSPKRFIDRLREFAAGIASQVRKLFSSSKQPARPKAAPQHPAERQHNARQAAPDHADQDSAPGASPQSVKQKPFTLSGARRSELAAEAKRADHKDRPQQRQAQTRSHDDDLLS